MAQWVNIPFSKGRRGNKSHIFLGGFQVLEVEGRKNQGGGGKGRGRFLERVPNSRMKWGGKEL